ncbi:unnamed protein product [Orchesella dallaii]|uniref:Peptidase S8/S53 domain-containing protein n=1 Tax=Orchesella dallaii TaxID=48710 RepID=A0ABP1PQF8_9HEXA
MFKLKSITIITTIFFIGATVAAPPASLSGSSTSKISSELQSRLQDGKRVNVFIQMSSRTSQVLQTVTQSSFISRAQRLNSIHHLLVRHADQTQKQLLDYMASLASTTQVEFKSFWITNQIYVREAELSLIENLSRFPDVESIFEEPHAHIFEPEEKKMITRRSDDDIEWGVRRIQAPEAWAELGKSDVEIRVGTLDTGVRSTHEALRDNFMGEYGWFDATRAASLTPTDNMGHGTHSTATIVGSKGVGVAPFAKWMSCRGCPTLGCDMNALLTCGQFFMCPTLADGSEPDCSKAPHLISNSWSAGQGQTWFNEVIDAWHAALIIPVFSIGNNGSYFCNSANYPGDYNVISVGSTDENEVLSWFSSVGPTLHGNLKPEVVAPGHDILSATHTADDAYELMSGTSFACPHVSGLVALLLSRNPNLTFGEAKDILIRNTDKNLGSTGRVCGGIPDTEYPNHVFGNGRANALKCVRALAVQMKQRS